MTTGQRIRWLRKQHDLTVHQAAAMVDVAPNTWCNIESGKDARIGTLKKVRELFNVTFDYLVGIDPNEGEIERSRRYIQSERDAVEIKERTHA